MNDLFGEDSDTEESVGGRWVVDRRRAAPLLVPLASLGRRVQMEEESAGQFRVARVDDDAGGPALRACAISEEMFSAEQMEGPVRKDLMAMKVGELKDELEARGAPRSGPNKMALRVRLRALMIRSAQDVRRAEEAVDGGGE